MTNTLLSATILVHALTVQVCIYVVQRFKNFVNQTTQQLTKCVVVPKQPAISIPFETTAIKSSQKSFASVAKIEISKNISQQNSEFANILIRLNNQMTKTEPHLSSLKQFISLKNGRMHHCNVFDIIMDNLKNVLWNTNNLLSTKLKLAFSITIISISHQLLKLIAQTIYVSFVS